MEEIAKIITAISEVTGLDRFSITYGRTDDCKRARGILCYIALKDKYGLTSMLSETLGKSRSQCTFAAEICQEEMEESIGYLILMNEIRKKLGMSAIMSHKIEEKKKEESKLRIKKSKERSKINSKNIFGMEYSPIEEREISQAILSSKKFMNEYCKVGIQADGRITRKPY